MEYDAEEERECPGRIEIIQAVAGLLGGANNDG